MVPLLLTTTPQISCRGRFRTYTEKLAAEQIPKVSGLVVNPLPCVYSLISTPETGGHVCQFQHPTFLKEHFKLVVPVRFLSQVESSCALLNYSTKE